MLRDEAENLNWKIEEWHCRIVVLFMGCSVFCGGLLFGGKRTPTGGLWGVETREEEAGLFSHAEITGGFSATETCKFTYI